MVDLTDAAVQIAQEHIEKAPVNEVNAIPSHTPQYDELRLQPQHKMTPSIRSATPMPQMSSHVVHASQPAQIKTQTTTSPPASTYPKISANFDKPKYLHTFKPPATSSKNAQLQTTKPDAPPNPQALNVPNHPKETKYPTKRTS